MNAPDFKEFLRVCYDMSLEDYNDLSESLKESIWQDYARRYA